MKELSSLIREYPELGDWMAEMYNRISYLEQSATSTRRVEHEPVIKTIEIANKNVAERLTGLENYLAQKQPPRKTTEPF